MRIQKGVTMTSLVISIIVLIIIASVASYAGIQSYSNARLEAYENKLKVVQKRADLITQEYFNWNGIDRSSGGITQDSFDSYLNSLGFTKLSTVNDSHAQALKNIINANSVKYSAKGSGNPNDYYYFTPDTIKVLLGIETLSDPNFYIAIYFSKPDDKNKKNFVVEEVGVVSQYGDDYREYHEYYSLGQ